VYVVINDPSEKNVAQLVVEAPPHLDLCAAKDIVDEAYNKAHREDCADYYDRMLEILLSEGFRTVDWTEWTPP
jgi:hypothetical protein